MGPPAVTTCSRGLCVLARLMTLACLRLVLGGAVDNLVLEVLIVALEVVLLNLRKVLSDSPVLSFSASWKHMVCSSSLQACS